MAKKKKQNRRPNIPPVTVLRPRLDNLFAQDGWVEQEAAQIGADLEEVTDGIAPEQSLPVLLKAVNDAPEQVQLALQTLIPTWLHDHDLIDPFTTLVQQDLFADQEYETAVAWLTDAGVAQTSLRIAHDPAFYRAYLGGDDMQSQGVFIFMWYSNRQQTRVRGFNVLIDYNPPWNGAAKEILYHPQRSPQEALVEFVDVWRNQFVPLAMEELDAVAAKRHFLQLLVANRENGIRLERDFSDARELLVEHLFPLPDASDTPLMTIEDFDELCQTGKTAESVRAFEKNIGRRIRLEDGSQLLVSADMYREDDDALD